MNVRAQPPSKIRRQRQSSFGEAKRQNAIKFEPIDFANMLRVAKADRHRLGIWQIAAIDATPEECRAFSERERDKKRRNAERSRAARCAAGATPREDKGERENPASPSILRIF